MNYVLISGTSETFDRMGQLIRTNTRFTYGMLNQSTDFDRPNTTLREIANLLYIAEPRYSDSMSKHDFRIVYYDPSAGMHRASAPVTCVTRATQQQIAALLKPAQHIEDTRSLLRDVGHGAANSARNDPANRTLAQMKFMPGDLLECAVSQSSSMQMRSTEQHRLPRHSAMSETRLAKSSRREWD